MRVGLPATVILHSFPFCLEPYAQCWPGCGQQLVRPPAPACAAAIISIDFAQTDIWSHQVLGVQTLHWIPLWAMVWATSFTNKTQTRNPSGCQPFLIYPIPALFPSLTCLSFIVALLCLVSRYHPRISFIKKSPYLETARFLRILLPAPQTLVFFSHTPMPTSDHCSPTHVQNPFHLGEHDCHPLTHLWQPACILVTSPIICLAFKGHQKTQQSYLHEFSIQLSTPFQWQSILLGYSEYTKFYEARSINAVIMELRVKGQHVGFSYFTLAVIPRHFKVCVHNESEVTQGPNYFYCTLVRHYHKLFWPQLRMIHF